MSKFVDVEAKGHILHLHLVRPEKYNALNLQMFDEISDGLTRLENDPELRVAVLSAEGRNFSAGVELDEWSPQWADGAGWVLKEGNVDPVGLSGKRHSKPLVIAVQGYSFTWAVEILLNSEIRVAATDTVFQMLEVQRGLFPCGGASFRLPQEIGLGNAQRYLLTGDRWSAEDALRWGMVQELTEPGKQVDRALEIAQGVAEAAPIAVQALLKSIRFAQNLDLQAINAQIFETLPAVLATEDAAEGVQSFLERRKAVFQGR